MKTLTSRSRLNPIALIVSLWACGDDPITVAEIIDAVRDNGPPSEVVPEPAPEEVSSDDVQEPVEEAPPAPDGEAPASEEEEQVVAILLEYCGDCHMGDPYDVPPRARITDIEQLIADNYIVPGARLDSSIYVRMLNGTMPPAFLETVPPEDIERVGAFIDSL